MRNPNFFQNKVVTSAEEGFVKVPCFEKMKIVQTLLLIDKNEWILVNDITIFR